MRDQYIVGFNICTFILTRNLEYQKKTFMHINIYSQGHSQKHSLDSHKPKTVNKYINIPFRPNICLKIINLQAIILRNCDKAVVQSCKTAKTVYIYHTWFIQQEIDVLFAYTFIHRNSGWTNMEFRVSVKSYIHFIFSRTRKIVPVFLSFPIW